MKKLEISAKHFSKKIADSTLGVIAKKPSQCLKHTSTQTSAKITKKHGLQRS